MPQQVIEIETRGPGLYEVTDAAQRFVRASGADEGLLTCFVRHTSASVVIQENADPDVQRDLQAFFARLVPRSDDPSMSWLSHTTEGPDDMPAHIKTMLTNVSLTIPVIEGRLDLGMWQGVYLIEHRAQRHERAVRLLFAGTG